MKCCLKVIGIWVLFSCLLGLCSPILAAPSDWAIEEVEKAISLSLVQEEYQSDYQTPITRAEFAACAVQLCLTYTDAENVEALADTYGTREKPAFIDLSKETAPITAYQLGIVKGRNDTIFDPNSPITRQEAAVMLMRTWQVCGGGNMEGTILSYSDSDTVADWAKTEVGQVSSLGIMNGMGDGSFAPLGQYTREQCYLTMVRLYDLLPKEETDELPEIQGETFTTSYFVYEITGEDTVKVIEYVGPDGIMVMQPEIDGYTVTGIGAGAFDGKTNVQLCVPDVVTEIEDGAFPADMKAVYYETAAGAVKKYAEKQGITAALWDWEKIAYIPWYKKNSDVNVPTPVHGKYANQDVAWEATTMIYCERSPEEDFEYTIENGEVTVYNYTGEGLYVSIQETIEDVPVKVVGQKAFSNIRLNHLEIPGTIRLIDHFAVGSYKGGGHGRIHTIHVLNGDSSITLGECIFTNIWNHVRFHNNANKSIVLEDYSESPNGMPIDMTYPICPASYEEVNGFPMTMFVYNAE